MSTSAGRRATRLVARRPSVSMGVAVTPDDDTPAAGPRLPARRLLPSRCHSDRVVRMSPGIATDRAADGWVVRVDVANRELTLLADGQVLAFDVPPGCAVVMNGQPVRLR